MGTSEWIAMDPTDPQFWVDLGWPNTLASVLAAMAAIGALVLGKQRKRLSEEEEKREQLLEQLANVPFELQQIRANQSSFSEALAEIREAQVEMATHIDWLRGRDA